MYQCSIKANQNPRYIYKTKSHDGYMWNSPNTFSPRQTPCWITILLVASISPQSRHPVRLHQHKHVYNYKLAIRFLCMCCMSKTHPSKTDTVQDYARTIIFQPLFLMNLPLLHRLLSRGKCDVFQAVSLRSRDTEHKCVKCHVVHFDHTNTIMDANKKERCLFPRGLHKIPY